MRVLSATVALALTDCDKGQVKCTKEMQASGSNCVIGTCTDACAKHEVVCDESLQRQGVNCLPGYCVALSAQFLSPEAKVAAQDEARMT
mmetsp:Transcript_5949/g.14441  ORF Transcript_5949/g.14441 Transcript_5949/m.14441 type:complete len:89 (+) Transcript_5949:61-327(+)